MKISRFMEMFYEHSFENCAPVVVKMGVAVLRDYIAAIESLPWEQRPYGWRHFMGATVEKAVDLHPYQIRFLMADGTSGDVELAHEESES